MRLRTCSLSDGLPIAFRSAPDEKWPPAPVRIAQRISGVSSTYSYPSARPTSMSGLERVARLGPVHREDHHVAVALDGAVLRGHRQGLGHGHSRVVGLGGSGRLAEAGGA